MSNQGQPTKRKSVWKHASIAWWGPRRSREQKKLEELMKEHPETGRDGAGSGTTS